MSRVDDLGEGYGYCVDLRSPAEQAAREAGFASWSAWVQERALQAFFEHQVSRIKYDVWRDERAKGRFRKLEAERLQLARKADRDGQIVLVNRGLVATARPLPRPLVAL